MPCKVSIIMPSYNSEEFISSAIESIINQSYASWELIVIDDNSSDATEAILSYYTSLNYNIKIVLNKKNMGAAHSRNNGIYISKGKYIAFLDSDDLWMPDKLEKQIRFMEENDLALSYTGYQKFSESTGDLGSIIPPIKTSYKKLLKSNIIGCLTAIYDTEKLGKCYMPLIRKRQDFGLWLSILEKTDKVAGLPEVLAKYRVDSGMTQNKVEVLKWQWKFYREVVGLSLLSSVYYFSHYAVNGFLKYKK